MSMESGGRAAARIRLWSLSEDVLVEGDPDTDRLVVVTRWGETLIDGVGDAVRESLRRMSLGPISLENVLPTGRGGEYGEGREWAQLRRVLDQLSGSVVHSLGMYDGDGPLVSAVPVARQATFRLPALDHRQPIKLSRFAAMRAVDGELLLESPLAQYRVVLHRQPASHVAAALSGATMIGELAPVLRMAQSVVADIVAFLVATGTVVLAEPAEPAHGSGVPAPPRFAEDHDPSLVRWSHHDLLFHSRSRMGRYGGPSGAVFPYAEELPSPPVVKQAPPGKRFPLYRPQDSSLVADDPPLTTVMENARLCPDLTARPLTADQIGELLYRAARIRSVSRASAGAGTTYEISDRPYLSMCGLHELELYVCVDRCTGLARGIYHYDPQEHLLTLVNDVESDLDELLDVARIAAGTVQRPPALISVAARAARSSWMFGGIAYSLTLTHVGALQQTLLLAATAMGLAGYVPPVDPADMTDVALRLDWPAEIGVGEFMVGHRQVAVSTPNGDL